MNKLTPYPMLFDLQRLVVDLALIDRNHHLAGHKRAENDIEHSFAVAMLCWFVYEKCAAKLSLEKVLRYALVHDFVERYAGDTNTYAGSAARANKLEQEKAALDRLSRELRGFEGLVVTMESYEAKSDEEALFVWTVDKMQAMIHSALDGWRPHRKIKVTYAQFVRQHSSELAACSPYCREIFAALLEYGAATYYDRPSSRSNM